LGDKGLDRLTSGTAREQVNARALEISHAKSEEDVHETGGRSGQHARWSWRVSLLPWCAAPLEVNAVNQDGIIATACA
jgi:hypothetical protein